MSTLRSGLLLVAMALLVPLAAAQDPTVNDTDYDTSAPANDTAYLDESENATAPEESADPTVTESDFDTTAPPADESYLDQAAGDPTVTESDFDTSAPAADESYLDDAEREANGGASSGEGRSGVPGPGIALTLAAAIVAIGLAARQK